MQRNGDGEQYYYLNNAHGDVEALIDLKGEVVNRYQYDAFGNIVEAKENVHNRFKYAGEQYDQVTGQYYLRARFYNPVVGRFTQEDVYRGDGLNLYAYVGNNPVNYVDLSGYVCQQKYDLYMQYRNQGMNPQQAQKLATADMAFDDLSKLRTELGMPNTGNRKVDGVLARLDINGNSYYGINSWAESDEVSRAAYEAAELFTKSGKVPFGPFTNHAEGDVFLQAFKAGEKGGTGILYVDSEVCGFCTKNLDSMRHALGLDKLEVFVKGVDLPIIFPK